jgi:hypothetical protein
MVTTAYGCVPIKTLFKKIGSRPADYKDCKLLK